MSSEQLIHTGSHESSQRMRLQKFLARAGVASRRASERLMVEGRVTVNGVIANELGYKIDPTCDEVAVDGQKVVLSNTAYTLALHKPCGIVSTMKDQSHRQCVADLVPLKQYPGLFPIGRLDADTTGLLLFSTDGTLGNALLHPRYHVKKHYIACVKGIPSPDDLQRLQHGINLDDGPTQPTEVKRLTGKAAKHAQSMLVLPSQRAQTASRAVAERKKERTQVHSFVSIVLSEGRYHQIKRMFAAIGHPVVALHRDQFGPIKLGQLALGAWRELSVSELSALYAAVSLHDGIR